MSATLLFIVSLIYWGVAIDQWWRGSPAGALSHRTRRISGGSAVRWIRWFAGVFSHVPKCPTEGKPRFSSGKTHFRIFSGLGLAFRPTLGILGA